MTDTQTPTEARRQKHANSIFLEICEAIFKGDRCERERLDALLLEAKSEVNDGDKPEAKT